ncbi:MAG: amidohydrolase family protein [Clostridia bacterium]|nr:amidohydrolase family protein [Clostridia bacterium]
MKSFALRGAVCHSVSPTEIRTIRGYAVCADGMARGVYETLPAAFASLPVIDCGDGLILPGMIDLHIHAAQYAYRGIGFDYELLDWLDHLAFPEEGKFADVAYADAAYTLFADAMKKSATSRACIFASRHAPATEILMKKMEDAGLVSYVGKVSMDRDAPDPLREESPEAAAAELRAYIEHTQGSFAHTFPILTPRFIPSCTDALMDEIGALQREFSLPVQSHLSENPGEIAYVAELRPDAAYYGDAYDKHGLFGRSPDGKPVPTIMSHCVFSGKAEIAKMREQDVIVVHCPASNMNVASGIAPIRRYLEAGLTVGLGSDVAGGQSESMFRAVTDAVQVSKLYFRHIDHDAKPIRFEEAFAMATIGGGSFFGNVGSFADGMEFDAVVLDDTRAATTLAMTDRQRLERAFYLGLDRDCITKKFVGGREIF